MITRYFCHFADDETIGDSDDKLMKVRHIPKSLTKFRGRLSFVQCNSSKHARLRIKVHSL
jgi:hypothetical protein